MHTKRQVEGPVRIVWAQLRMLDIAAHWRPDQITHEAHCAANHVPECVTNLAPDDGPDCATDEYAH